MDIDNCFDIMRRYDRDNTGEEMVFKRRTYLPWSPFSKEVREANA